MEIIKRESILNDELVSQDLEKAKAEFLDVLMSADEEDISLDLPQGISAKKLTSYMDISFGTLSKLANASFKIKPLLSQLIAAIVSRPDMMQQLGARDVTHLCGEVLPKRYGISRTEGFRLLNLGKEYPNLTVEQYDKIGPAKLKAIAKAVPQNSSGLTPEVIEKRQELMAIAPDMRFDKFAKHLEDNNIAPPGSVMTYHINIAVDSEAFKRWRDFITDNDIIQYVQSKSMSAILDAMIAECSVAWKAEMQARRNQ
jgi:hypothetical protein